MLSKSIIRLFALLQIPPNALKPYNPRSKTVNPITIPVSRKKGIGDHNSRQIGCTVHSITKQSLHWTGCRARNSRRSHLHILLSYQAKGKESDAGRDEVARCRDSGILGLQLVGGDSPVLACRQMLVYSFIPSACLVCLIVIHPWCFSYLLPSQRRLVLTTPFTMPEDGRAWLLFVIGRALSTRWHFFLGIIAVGVLFYFSMRSKKAVRGCKKHRIT